MAKERNIVIGGGKATAKSKTASKVRQSVAASGAQNLQELIDRGAELSRTIKECEAELKGIKETVKQYARENSVTSVSGTSGEAKLSAYTTTETGTVTEFITLLKSEGKLSLIDTLLSVKMSDAKKYLGEEALRGFIRVKTDPYGKVSFK